ncbi:hypothetical protein E2C01_012473 [Portunus trituberculatus]|uniref:Uncharacterized protein n=1 Tax=Portunus trituberculatus TaxID=210409 RepID=A0A5B7DEN6_PORTR|nr:hypothetical protein [Portunus trituberculatus]
MQRQQQHTVTCEQYLVMYSQGSGTDLNTLARHCCTHSLQTYHTIDLHFKILEIPNIQVSSKWLVLNEAGLVTQRKAESSASSFMCPETTRKATRYFMANKSPKRPPEN